MSALILYTCCYLLSLLLGVMALQQPRQHAVVVGCGPVGVAASLMLASRHNFDVTLLESSLISQSKYDPTKAFLYNVNHRGQKLTKMFPGMHQKLQDRSVASRGFADTLITIVPADPSVPIPQQKKNMEGTTKENKEEKNAPDDKNTALPSSEKATGVGYWIPRHEMVKLMVEEIDEHNRRGLGGKISLCFGQECVSVLPNGKDNDITVITEDASKNDTDSSTTTAKEYHANLVIGADGMNSKVRDCLANAQPGTWSTSCAKSLKFLPKKYTSPASFLRIKVLQLPPQFEIPDTEGRPSLKTNSEKIYAIRSVNTGPRTYLSLGLLPMKDNNAVRPTNIITRPDHEVWKITDGKAMREYFQKAFPRLNFQEGGLVTNEEWERFAKAEGTRFPSCQYSHGMAVWDESGRNGVALVGDSIHAFPPDIGQGVNAGLMDVVCLDRALSGLEPETGKEAAAADDDDASTTEKSKTALAANLERYQKKHAPEIAALIRLARFGAPYQYKQPHYADRALRMLWTLNVVMRLLLSKVSLGFIQPPCIILSQNKELTFRQVMNRADRSTAVLKTLFITGVAFWAKKRFGLNLFSAFNS